MTWLEKICWAAFILIWCICIFVLPKELNMPKAKPSEKITYTITIIGQEDWQEITLTGDLHLFEGYYQLVTDSHTFILPKDRTIIQWPKH